MINIKKYALASLTGLIFASFLPLSFAYLYTSSMNMIHGFVQKGGDKEEITVIDAFTHLFGEMPHLWFLAIIPALIGFRFGLRLNRNHLDTREPVKGRGRQRNTRRR